MSLLTAVSKISPFYLFFFLIALTGCQKEKRAFNRLEGTWFVELLYVDEEQKESSVASFTFSECGYDSDEFCPLEIRMLDATVLNYEYRFKTAFNYIELRNSTTPNEIIKYDIIQFKRKRLVLEFDAFSVGTFKYYFTKD